MSAMILDSSVGTAKFVTQGMSGKVRRCRGVIPHKEEQRGQAFHEAENWL
jgi:hypothetical protein